MEERKQHLNLLISSQEELKERGVLTTRGLGYLSGLIQARKILFQPDDVRKTSPMTLTPIHEWVEAQPKISTRLMNVLGVSRYGALSSKIPSFDLVEIITKRAFLQRRNAGKKSWEEFVQLRGWERQPDGGLKIYTK